MENTLERVVDGTTVERVLLDGDLGKLSPAQRVTYYGKVCDTLGLNPLTRPFEYLILNNKLTLYARREATEQLRHLHHVSLTIAAREVVEDTYIVTARAVLPDGRTDESIGAKSIANLKGEARANAMMTAETKAKRRVTLSICGLGLLDETEVADIPAQIQRPPVDVAPPHAGRLASSGNPSEPNGGDSAILPVPPPRPKPDPDPPPPQPTDELPAAFVRIVRIHEAPTRNAGVIRYSVILSSGVEVTTVNPWYATLAKNAHETQTPVIVRTKKTKYGDQITAIESDLTVDSPMPTADEIPF
jgi:hypothetical protein